MAFTDQEKQIIIYGNQAGRTKEEIKQALIRYRTGQGPIEKTEMPSEEPGLFSRIGSTIQKRGEAVAEEFAKPSAREPGETLFGFDEVATGVKATGQAFGGIGDVATELLKTLPGGKKLFDYLGQKISSLTEKIASTKLFREAADSPERLQGLEEFLGVLGAEGDIAGNILVADSAAKGLTKSVVTGQKVASKTADIVSAGFEKAGELLKTGGEKLYKTSFNLTADEARAVQGWKINVQNVKNQLGEVVKGSKEAAKLADDLKTLQEHPPILRGDTAFQKGLYGTETSIGTQAGVEKLGLWRNTVEPALKGSTAKITKAELFKKAAERVASEAEPIRKAALKNAYDAIVEEYKNFKPTDLLTANKIKTSLDTFTPSKIFKGQDVANELKTLKADMASSIRQKTYESLKNVKIKEAYRDYANLKRLEEVGVKALTEAGFKGGFGGFWSTLYDMATVPVKTIGGQVLYKVGNAFEFLGEKGIKTFGEYLNNVGFQASELIGLESLIDKD